jgi:hypothetical protein
VPVDRTRLKARLFDRERARKGYDDSLEFVAYNVSTGHAAVKTIDEGWCPYLVTDQALGEQFFEVNIGDVGQGNPSEPTFAAVFAAHLTHLKFEGKHFKLTGAVIPPIGGIKLWKVRCSPTGTPNA